MIAFHASDEASFMTGANVAVDRGVLASNGQPQQVERSGPHQREIPVPRGSVVAVAIDAKHRFSKTPRLSIILTTGHGVEGDAHYGEFVRHRYLARRNPRAPNLRQVHLIPSELFDALRNSGFDVSPGDLGENITTAGLDLETLPLNTELHIGASANIRLTGLRTPCILIDRFRSRIETPTTRRNAESAFPSWRHGGRVRRRRNITRRPHPCHPSRAPSSASSPAVNSLRRGAFSRLQDRGFPVACPRA